LEDESQETKPVLLFDGTCHFCNSTVQFIVDHERTADLRFAPIQSDVAHDMLLKAVGEAKTKELEAGADGSGDPDSLVLIEDGHAFTHSTGALRTARMLRWPWRLAFVFVIVPRPIRDWFYRWFARHRYRWFGKDEQCRIPTPELRTRFLG
jgi:predicted DCC family thiol-disulfide oxidoreductase YuxK